MLAMRTLVNDIGNETSLYKELKNVPNDRVRNFRNDLYLVSEALRLTAKSGLAEILGRRCCCARQLQEARRSLYPFHPYLGEGCGGDGTRFGNHDRLEADRGHRRRKDRQGTPDLRSGRRRGNHRYGNDRRCRRFWSTCKHHARALFGCGGHDGRQSFWNSAEYRAQPGVGLGSHAARRDAVVGLAVLALPQDLLSAIR